jgi:hypothetical protein
MFMRHTKFALAVDYGIFYGRVKIRKQLIRECFNAFEVGAVALPNCEPPTPNRRVLRRF